MGELMKSPFVCYSFEDIPGNVAEGALSSYFIEQAALARGLFTKRLSGNLLVCSSVEKSVLFNRGIGPGVSQAAARVCGNKAITQSILDGSQLPTTCGMKITRFAQAKDYFLNSNMPVVLKPLSGSKGRGVICNIDNLDDLRAAWKMITQKRSVAMIEKHFEGVNLRIMVIGNQAVSSMLRSRPNVLGDGESSIRELIELKNMERSKNPHLKSRLISLSDSEQHLKKAECVSLDHVPEFGKVVELDMRANISRGGDSIDVTDETHESYFDLAVSAAASVPGLEQAGVDLMVKDYTLPLNSENCVIGELEAVPALGVHLPSSGPGRDVAKMIIKHYFPE